MILLFGTRTSRRHIASPAVACPFCGNVSGQSLIRAQNRFTLFFIPLFPIGRARYHLECGHCGGARAVAAEEADRLAV